MQTVEIVHQLPPARGEEEPVGAAILGVVPPLEQAVLDETIEQPHKRDRLQFEHVGEIDLRQPLLIAQAKQHDPLRTGGAAALRAVVDEIAQEPRTLHELRDQLALQIK